MCYLMRGTCRRHYDASVGKNGTPCIRDFLLAFDLTLLPLDLILFDLDKHLIKGGVLKQDTLLCSPLTHLHLASTTPTTIPNPPQILS